MTDRLASRRTSFPTAGLMALAGLAVGLGSAQTAEAISFVKLRTNHSVWNSVAVPDRDMEGNIIWTDLDGDGERDRFETQTVQQAITGQGVTVGMLEPAHPLINTNADDPNAPFEHHLAFDGLDHRRIWYPFETPQDSSVSTIRRQIAPRDEQGFLIFPTSHHQHATAVAGAICARNETLEGGISSIGPVTGIAPNVQLLSGSLITSTDPQNPSLGTAQGVTLEAFLFTLAAMTDVDFTGDGVGDYIEPLAEWYGVEPWEPATVINISFGRARAIDQRAGEDAFARICDVIAYKTNTLIIAAAGDEGRNPIIDEEEMENDTGRIASPASAHNTISVGRTGDQQNRDNADPDSSFGPMLRYNWIHKDLDGNLYTQTPVGAGSGMEGADYSDINFLDGADPRDPPMQSAQLFPNNRAANPDGLRPGVDIVAPGTMIELPGDLTLPQGQLGLTRTWAGFEGTSFATAITTGAVALLHEYGELWEYSIDPVVVRAVLLNSADKPTSWNNGGTGEGAGNVTLATNQGLDEELGAGILDFERLLLQYRSTPGGYPDLGPASEEFIRNSIFPLYRRNPNIGSDPADPEYIEGPNSGPFGTVDFMPVVSALRGESRYFESFVNDLGQDTQRAYFYTDPDFATITFFSDPTAGMTALTAPRTRTDDTSTRVGDATHPPLPGGDTGGFRSYSAQPVSDDRYGFDDLSGGGPGGSTGRLGGIGGGVSTGNRTGSGSTGTSTGGRPGGGGDDGGADNGGTSASGLRACSSPSESRCVRTGWDIGRIGVGSIILPIGGLPEGSDVTATLVWNRIEAIDDSVYEGLLDGVISAEDPPPPSLPITAPTNELANDAELFQDDVLGPMPEPVYSRSPKAWPSDRPNFTNFPLVMAGETLRGPAPDFIDLDMDRDGVLDFPTVDNCIELMGAINNIGLPSDPNLDSYNPLQVDMDMDGCGPPCDSDDASAFPPNPEDEPLCNLGANGSFTGTDDSERLRRVATDYYNTAKDELDINPLALSGVVALRINRGNGNFDMATGVLIDQQRILTAAHPFDENNDGIRDPGTSFSVVFPGMSRSDAQPVLQSGGDLSFTISRFDIHPSYNYLGDRTVDGFDPANIIENGRDDLAVITYVGDSFADFIDQRFGIGQVPYTGAQLQIYDIFRDPPPELADSQEIIFAGYGESGDARFGVPVDLNTETPPPGFVPQGFNAFGAPFPILRLGKNVIEFFPFDNDDDNIDSETAPREQFGFDFNNPNSLNTLGNRVESMITFGDSGSPAFIHNDINMDGIVDLGELQLFGINTMVQAPAGSVTISAYESRGLGNILSGYVGVDEDGNDRWLDAILNDQPPQLPETIGFGNRRSAHFDLTTAFKFDNLNLSLFRDTLVGGSGFPPTPTATSSSANNVEHIYATDIEAGQYVLLISWQGPVFDWSGFFASGPTPFRKVPPVGYTGDPLDDPLSPDDLIDFFPSEVKYGLAWWCDIPYDLLFERNAFGARTIGQLHGDLNADQLVNAADLSVMLSAWGSDNWHCDLDDSGVVDIADLAVLLRNYNH